MINILKCSFCEKTVRDIDEEELNEGWGRLEGAAFCKRVQVISCPEHKDLAWDEFMKNMKEIEVKHNGFL